MHAVKKRTKQIKPESNYFDRYCEAQEPILQDYEQMTIDQYLEKIDEHKKEITDLIAKLNIQNAIVTYEDQDSYGDGSNYQTMIRGRIPWTDEKIQQHKDKLALDERIRQDEIDEKDRQEYSRLQAKFAK